jgi:hypothetical protein
MVCFGGVGNSACENKNITIMIILQEVANLQIFCQITNGSSEQIMAKRIKIIR